MAENMFEFKIEGVKELDKVLATLPKAAEKQQLKATLRRSAKPLLQDARKGASRISSGLASSIKIRTMTKTVVPAAVSIGPDADHWWAYLWEFGTGVYGPKGTPITLASRKRKGEFMYGEGLDHPIRVSEGVKPKPFMRPAWDRNKNRVRDNFARELMDQLLRFAARLKKQAYSGKLSRAGMRALGL